MPTVITKPDAPVREEPTIDPSTRRRPKQFCDDQSSRGAWEIC